MADSRKPFFAPRRFEPDRSSRLLEYLLRVLAPMNRTRVKELLRFGSVAVNGVAVTQFDHPIDLGDVVAVGKPQPVAAMSLLEKAGISIVHEDETLILIDKPVGMLSIGTEKQKIGTAYQLVNEYLRKHSSKDALRAYVVHRLDRETSGLLLLAKSPEIQDRLQATWAETVKGYIAVVEGIPQPSEDTISSHLIESAGLRSYSGPPGKDSRLAVTHYRVLGSLEKYSSVEVRLETGRKHQIRVHLADRGTPVVGDSKYGARTDTLGRLGLHAWTLSLVHPLTGERVEWSAPLPAVFKHWVPS